MSKIKMVHIVQSLQTGGAEKLLVDLSIHCKEEFETIVICQYEKANYQYEKILEDNNIKVIYLKKKKGLDIKNFFDVFRILNEIKPSVVHTHLHACIYAIPWYLARKNIVKVHTIHTIANMEFGKVHRILQNFAYNFLGVIPVAISNIVKDSILCEYKVNKEKVPIIHNGINIRKYSSPKVLKENDSLFRIVNVASFSKWKNQIYLLNSFNNALRQNSNMHLSFVGEGPLRDTVQQKAKEMQIDGIHVEFVGVSSEVEKYLNRSDVFVLCSTFEGLPLSILEAYAAGLPVISTNVGGIPNILVDGENGFLVEVNDETAMENAIIKLCNDKALREKIGKTNMQKAKEFDIEITTKKYIDIYKSNSGA